MVLLNTSFHMHRSVEKDFLHWIRTAYAPALESHGGMGYPTFARIDTTADEETTVGYCFQMTADSAELASRWHDSQEAAALRDRLTRACGEKLVYFTTCMEIIALHE